MKLLCKYSSKSQTKKITDNFCIYASNDFDNIPPKVARANKSGYAIVKVLGTKLPRQADWTIEFEGEWKQSHKFGWTFFASSYELVKPSNEKGIEKFLCSKTFPGIGEKTAHAIVQEFKKDTLDVIENNPNLLLRIDGLSMEKIGTITECYKKNITYSKLCSYLAMFGVSQNIATRINEKYGDDSIDIIKDNPYLIQDIRGVGFLTCEKIAKTENCALDSYVRIKGAITEVLKRNSETGDMYMNYTDLKEQAMAMLNNIPQTTQVVSCEKFANAMEIAVRQGVIVARNKNQIIYLKEYDDAEDIVAKNIAYYLTSKPINDERVDKELTDYLKTSPIQLSEHQKEAVERSLKSRISIITGGPGTGKTTILKTIISVYMKLNPSKEITLLAPTGKAASRMSLSSGYPASTIHSKLNIYDDFINTDVKIENGLIAVDETSMVDNLLLEKLFSAVQNDSQIIFIGDVSQLPSVGAGDCLHQMIDSNLIPVSRLTEIFRQKEDCTIIENAIAVNNGDTTLNYDDTFELIVADDETDAVRKIKDLYTSECRDYGIDNVALLSPRRQSQSGRFTCVSDELNNSIQDVVNPAKTGDISILCNSSEYRIGDRVLQWKNRKDINNGDVGVITKIDHDDNGVIITVKWENGKTTTEDRETLNDMTLAYSLSVHKSQGSEYDSVIIPLLSNQICPLFKRNLLYTAITRSKKKCILVTDKNGEAINYCILNKDSSIRKTLLSRRIVKYFETYSSYK